MKFHVDVIRSMRGVTINCESNLPGLIGKFWENRFFKKQYSYIFRRKYATIFEQLIIINYDSGS